MRWLFLIPAALVAFIIGASIYLQPNDFIGCIDRPLPNDQRCQAADAIVVVSGGDTAARTTEGIRLYENGWAETLIFSGAAQDKSGPSNAAAMKQIALDSGVPASAILVDESSENTEENAQNTRSIFEVHGYKTVILVTSGYHQRRASLEFQTQAASTTILNHPLLQDSDWSLWWWLTPRGWWLVTGELIKITAFYAQETW